jgi:hypothetical protein
MVTGDETLVHHHSLETKLSSMELKLIGSPQSNKFKTGNLLVNCVLGPQACTGSGFYGQGTRINAASYCVTLQGLGSAIK